MNEAFHRLCDEIEELVQGHEKQLAQIKWSTFFNHIMHSSYYTLISYVFVVGMAVSLLIAAGSIDSDR